MLNKYLGGSGLWVGGVWVSLICIKANFYYFFKCLTNIVSKIERTKGFVCFRAFLFIFVFNQFSLFFYWYFFFFNHNRNVIFLLLINKAHPDCHLGIVCVLAGSRTLAK